MPNTEETSRNFRARWTRLVHYFKVNFGSRWDRVYLCSMAPMSAELVRDYEDAEQHHRQW